MTCEYTTIADQTIPAGGSVSFSLASVPCLRGLIYPRNSNTQFMLSSPALMGVRRTYCCRMPLANYNVSFHGNVAVPEGGTVEQLSLQIAVDGVPDPGSLMLADPTAVELFSNVGTDIVVAVPWICRCSTVTVINPGTADITLRAGATLKFDYAGVTM